MKKVLIYSGLNLLLLCLYSCGSTRVSVEKPAAGTQTTITVTTNNPIKTEVNPTTNANINIKTRGQEQ